MTTVMFDFQSFMNTYTWRFMLIAKDEVIHVHDLRLVAIGYKYVTLP